jgi:hypothetical protein
VEPVVFVVAALVGASESGEGKALWTDAVLIAGGIMG